MNNSCLQSESVIRIDVNSTAFGEQAFYRSSNMFFIELMILSSWKSHAVSDSARMSSKAFNYFTFTVKLTFMSLDSRGFTSLSYCCLEYFLIFAK